MTMLTLVGPRVAQSLQLTFNFKCEAFQVHQNAWRQIRVQLSFDIHLEDCKFAKPSPHFGKGWQARRCAHSTTWQRCICYMCSTGLATLSLTSAFLF